MKTFSRVCFYVFYAAWCTSFFTPKLFSPEQQLSYLLGTCGIFLATFFIGRWALKSAFMEKTVIVNVTLESGADLKKLEEEMNRAVEESQK